MNQIIFVLLSLIMIISIVNNSSLKCGEEEIINCKVCNDEDDFNSCGVCEKEHFPLLENKLCFPCNDSLYGQIGCKGECNSSDYSNSGFAYCQECKEGFYNLEGICHKCSQGSPGCLECSYEKSEAGNKQFKCHRCLNDEEYRIDDFQCLKCNELITKCQKCHFIGEGISQF